MPSRLAIAAILAICCSNAAAQTEAPSPRPVAVDAEIVLAVDASRSMDLTEFDVQRDGYAAGAAPPGPDPRDRRPGRLGARRDRLLRMVGPGAGRHAGPLADHRRRPTTPPRMADEIADDARSSRSRGTSISRALDFAAVLIEDGTVEGDAPGDRRLRRRRQQRRPAGHRRPRRQRSPAASPSTACRSSLSADGIGSFADLDRYYEDCVIGGEGAFVLVAPQPATSSRAPSAASSSSRSAASSPRAPGRCPRQVSSRWTA